MCWRPAGSSVAARSVQRSSVGHHTLLSRCCGIETRRREPATIGRKQTGTADNVVYNKRLQPTIDECILNMCKRIPFRVLRGPLFGCIPGTCVGTLVQVCLVVQPPVSPVARSVVGWITFGGSTGDVGQLPFGVRHAGETNRDSKQKRI